MRGKLNAIIFLAVQIVSIALLPPLINDILTSLSYGGLIVLTFLVGSEVFWTVYVYSFIA